MKLKQAMREIPICHSKHPCEHRHPENTWNRRGKIVIPAKMCWWIKKGETCNMVKWRSKRSNET